MKSVMQLSRFLSVPLPTSVELLSPSGDLSVASIGNRITMIP